MKPNSAWKAFILLAALGCTQGALADSSENLGGAWDSRQVEGRPLLFWEELKGYRLFFHPEDTEPLRRLLTISVAHEEPVTASWAIIRPLRPELEYADAWLRVEGEPSSDFVNIKWDGQYRGRPFPDGPYLFEIHVRWKSGDERNWKVVVLKCKDYPLISKIGGETVTEKHPLMFKNGQFEPVGVSGTFSRSGAASLPLLARVYAPDLEGSFSTAGIQVQGRLIEDLQGKPVAGKWECLCQQELPADSLPRKQAKKVRCDWDLSTASPGVWDLRLGLYHFMKHRLDMEPCDAPVLDEDRIRVVITP